MSEDTEKEKGNMKTLTIDDVTIEVTCEPSDTAIEGSFASGDDDADAALVAEIREHAEWNVWAWCDVRVRVSWRGLHADTYLGAGSYKDEADFRTNSGYFQDMFAGALADLNAQAQSIARALTID